MTEASRAAAIIVAAGAGRRVLDGGIRKQYRRIAGEPMLSRAIRPFLDHPEIGDVIAVIPPEDVGSPPPWLKSLPVRRVAGGSERTDSVRLGLEVVDARFRVVLIHDGARPFVGRRLIDRVLEAARTYPAAGVIPGERLTDTIKEVGTDGLVARTVPRERLWRVQTPQAFPLTVLRGLHAEAVRDGFTPTDDAMLFERRGLPVHVVDGDPLNIKVTTTTDLALAEVLAGQFIDSVRGGEAAHAAPGE